MGSHSEDTDYQKFMDADTRSVDTAGNQAADAATVENYGAGEETVTIQNDAGQTIHTSQSVFGMLPEIRIPLEYTQQRRDFFRKQADGANKSVGGQGAKPANRLVENYDSDLNYLPRAGLHYNTLVPMANLAAKAYAKADEVGKLTGHNLDTAMSATLDRKETTALGKASHRSIDKKNSVGLAGDHLTNKRNAMIGASTAMARTVREQVIVGLQGEMDAAKQGKDEIAAKIARITKIVGYVEQAGAFVAGAGGFANAHLPGGVEEEKTPDTKPTWGDDMEKGGGAVKSGGGMVSSAVSFGLNLYYEEKVAALDRQITTIKGEIGVHKMANAKDALEEVHRAFKAATGEYKTAVEDYLAAITNRRELTAQIGQTADHIVDKKGRNNDSSDAMLWMTTVKETQAHLGVGLDAGADAAMNIVEVVQHVFPHRNHYSQDQAVREAHRGGPGADYSALEQMAKLVGHWVSSAERVKAIIDEHADTELDPMREQAGWSGRY